MIIYGYKHRNVTLASGRFMCPQCKADRAYRHLSVVRDFTLFFIPLFPLGTVSSYIECDSCRSAFKPEQLVGTPGNEQLVRDMAARKTEADRQRKALGGRNLAVIGVVLMVSASVCWRF